MKAGKWAAKLANEYNTRDPFLLCGHFNILVARHRLGSLRGYYTQRNGVDVIVLAKHLAEWPARYVCAHELGHYLLHRNLNRVFMDACTYMLADRYENEADYFACQLLFSQPPLFAEQTLTTRQMAECLNVPLAEVDARLIQMDVYH